jgi:hypothetical protein
MLDSVALWFVFLKSQELISAQRQVIMSDDSLHSCKSQVECCRRVFVSLIHLSYPVFRLGKCRNVITTHFATHASRGGSGSNPGLVMWDFVTDKSGAGAGFLRELRFPLPIYTPSTSPQSSSLSPEADTIGQEWPQCQ